MARIVLIALIALPTAVHAETWTAQTSLDRVRSLGKCHPVYVTYTFDLTNDTFTATSDFGKMFSITVPPDGMIREHYGRLLTLDVLDLEMTGNVKSRDLEVQELKTHCHYKLAPRA
jgi:hypothetical protein